MIGPILEMRHITKKFPGVTALNDVSIALERGEILSICGENGAGKSTLMKILSGEYAHGTYSGSVLLEGKELRISSNRVAETVGIAMIYQEISVELDLSVAENILLGMLPLRKTGLVDWKTTRSIVSDILKKLRIDLDVNLKMRELSASVQQLVCIARALVRKPKILILDEPTAALTESETEYLIKILQELKSSGISCIYISHKLDEVFRISDRIVVMRDARVISGYTREQIDPAQIIEDMIGRRMDQIYPSMEERIIGEEVFRIENFTVPHPHAAKNIITDAQFSIRRGEVLGLAGLVGSGRSELLRAIFGSLPKVSGDVYVEGKKCNIANPADAIRNGIGFLTEDRKKDGIVATMNILQNMTLSTLKKISRFGFIQNRAERGKAEDYFWSMHIKAPSLKTGILNLSGGNQQKVVLAKSLLTDMKVLFLDEPTRGIDVGAKAEIYKIIQDLSSKGLSIVMISSEHPELLAMCDRFVVIGNGRIAGGLTKAEADETKIIRMASHV
jgi:ABC-type sugar transport system ATPase subunit